MDRTPRMDRILGPMGSALVIAGVFGAFVTWWFMPRDESELISRFAQKYQQDTGGALTDCIGLPSEVDSLRLYVICKPAEGAAKVYLINHRGKRVKLPSLEQILREQAT